MRTNQITMTQEMIDRYGRINGDNDIIHYDEAYAAERGFRGTLAHGLHVMAYPAELAAQHYGDAWYERGSLEIIWTKPVCPGDDVVAQLEEDGTIRVEAEHDGGTDTVLVGTATIAD